MRQKNVLIVCDKIIAFSFYAIIFFLPISIAIIESFAGLAQVVFFIKRGVLFSIALQEERRQGHKSAFFKTIGLFFRSFKPVSSSLSEPIGIFIFVNFLTILVSQYPELSLKAFFCKTLEVSFMTYIFIEAFNQKERIRKFLLAWLLSAFVIAVDGIFQFTQAFDFIHGYVVSPGRVGASFKHPNDFGSYIVIIVMLVMCLLLFWLATKRDHVNDLLGPRKFKFKHLPLFALIGLSALWIFALICLGLTYSRGAWAGFFISVAFVTFLRKEKLLFHCLIVLLFIAVFFPNLQRLRNASFTADNVTNERELIDLRRPENTDFNSRKLLDLIDFKIRNFGAAGRKGYWQEAVNIIKDYPVLGTGLNTYSQVAPKYKLVWGGYAHNCYLQMMAETGILGLMSFLWVLFVLFYKGIVNLRIIKDPFGYAVVLGSLAGLAGFLFQTMFDTNLYSVQLSALLWTTMGLIVSVPRAYIEGYRENYNLAFFSKLFMGFGTLVQNMRHLERPTALRLRLGFTVKKFIFYNLMVLLILIALFIVNEVFFRIFRGPPNPLLTTTQKSTQYLFDPGLVLHNLSSVSGEYDYTANINQFGYRGKDFSLEKKPDTLRIFVVGDSFTFGVGSQDHQTIPYLLGQKFKERNVKAEVINAGIGHSSPIQHYVNLRNIHLKYKPDAVFLLFDLTDLWDDWHSERHAVYDKKGEIIRFDLTYIDGKRSLWLTLVKYSAFCKYLHDKVVRTFEKMHYLGFKKYLTIAMQGKKAKAEIINSKEIESDDVLIEYDGLLMMRGREKKDLIEKHWGRTTKYLTKIKELLDEQHIPLILVVYPHGIHVGKDQWGAGRLPWGFEANKIYTDTYPFELIENYAKEKGIPCIETLDDFLARNEVKLFFDWDGHLTPAGNEVMAQGIISDEVFQNVFAQWLPTSEVHTSNKRSDR